MRLSWILLLAACGRPALTFAPDTLPEATVSQPYHATIQVSGGETPVGGISAAPLPPGLALAYDRSHNGVASIDGTPTTAGRVAVTVNAWCFGTNQSGQTGRRTYELVVR